jgi:serine protease Do
MPTVINMQTQEIQENVIRVAEMISKSVVQINSIRMSPGRIMTPGNVQATATGIIISSSGYIVTNNHVVDESLRTEVIFPDGTSLEADIVGYDFPTDLALLKTSAKGMHPVRFSDSEKIRVGQFAIAVGNSLGLPGAPTVSLGVVSATGRPMPWADFIFEGLMQTDAAINPGNSGGPLVDITGGVIGINTAMVPYAQGVGFAIPSNTVSRVVEQILDTGKVVRPWLGISGVSVTREIAERFGIDASGGVIVLRLTPNGPANRAGLAVYDTIISVDGKNVDSMRTLLSELSKVGIGEAPEFIIIRRNRKFSVRIVMEEMPEYYVRPAR